MRTLLIVMGLFLVMIAPAQQAGLVNGRVIDEAGQGLYAATVLLKGNQSVYTFTGDDGVFSLQIPENGVGDSLEVRYTGMKPTVIAFKKAELQSDGAVAAAEGRTGGEAASSQPTAQNPQLLITMLPTAGQSIAEVTVVARTAVAEEFSVEKIERMDVYFNPLAKGDPLNAVQLMAASTDTEESASPSLRGSAPNRSIVVIDGVPVRNPVRYTQISGTGSFSILNTEMLESQLVYASNPPLAYGNSSAGLIEIQLRETDVNDGLSIGGGLAQAGASFTKKAPDDKGYFTIYGNLNFSGPYKLLNEEASSQLNDFGSADVGVRYFRKYGDHKKLSLFNYSNTENYDFSYNLFAFDGSAIAEQKRNFMIAKLEWGSESNVWSINTGADITSADFSYGNLISNTNRKDIFTGINYRKNHKNFVLQSGVSHRWSSDQFEEQLPRYYFAMDPEKPTFKTDSLFQQNDIQGFAYVKYYLNKFTLSAGGRGNVATQEQEDFLSYQGAAKYDLNNQHSMLLSAGKYHNYNYPTAQARNLDLLSSTQYALEYNYLSDKTEIKFGGFIKEEDNNAPVTDRFVENVDGKQYIRGLELSLKQDLGSRITIDLANTLLDVEVEHEGQRISARNDLGYLLKAGLTYFNNDVFSLGASFISRPGTRYTDIDDSFYVAEIDAYAPIFQNQLNGSRYGNYQNVSLTANRALQLKNDRTLVFYSVLNNVLGKENESNAIYDKDYSQKNFEFYGKRWAYIGAQFQF